MTTEEKQAVQLMAAKYEKYGVSFFELLRMFGAAPHDRSFKDNFKAINAELKAKYESKTE